jgi:protein TonB
MERPKLTFDPEPDYSDAGRKDKISGSVGLWVNIGADGLVNDVCVARSLRADMDERAVARVKTWRFEPARKDGVAVAANLYMEVNFNIKK